MHVLRLFSALLAACTVLLIFLFLRELLPSTPWAWTVGALAVAFQPMFGFTSSGVTSDCFLYPASAGIFYTLALAFRRGLTPRRGAAIGAFASVGILAKMNMLGLAPGIAVGLLALVIGAGRERRGEALRGVLAAVAIVAVPLAIYMLLNSTVWDRGLYFGAGGVQGPTGIVLPGGVETTSATVGDAFDYMWQFYLPRLPSMHPMFDTYQLRQVWFNGFIGQFGWLDYGFPQWVYNLALAVAFGILALVARELIAVRQLIRSRLGELITYLTLVAGLLVLIGGVSYIARIGGATGLRAAALPLSPARAVRRTDRDRRPRCRQALRTCGRGPARLHRHSPHGGLDAAHAHAVLRLRPCPVRAARPGCSTMATSRAAGRALGFVWPAP